MRFTDFTRITMTVSSRIWCSSVWKMFTNVSEKPSASNTHDASFDKTPTCKRNAYKRYESTCRRKCEPQRERLSICVIKINVRVIFFPVLPDVLISVFLDDTTLPLRVLLIRVVLRWRSVWISGRIIPIRGRKHRGKKQVPGLILPPQRVQLLVPVSNPGLGSERPGNNSRRHRTVQRLISGIAENSPLLIEKLSGQFIEIIPTHCNNRTKGIRTEWAKLKAFTIKPGIA
jgi:hypothetical protein